MSCMHCLNAKDHPWFAQRGKKYFDSNSGRCLTTPLHGKITCMFTIKQAQNVELSSSRVQESNYNFTTFLTANNKENTETTFRISI